MVEIPKLPTINCPPKRDELPPHPIPVAIFCFHTVAGVPVPIQGVDVEVLTGLTTKYNKKTDTGGLVQICAYPYIPIVITVKKDGVDFGKGKGQPVKMTDRWFTTPQVYTFKAKIGCGEISLYPPSIATSNFKFGAIPNITVLPVNVSTPAGSFTIKSGRYVFYLNNVKIAEGGIPESGKIDHNLPDLRDISGIRDLLGQNVELKVEITAGEAGKECKFTGTKTLTLPGLPRRCTGTIDIAEDAKEIIQSALAGSIRLPSSINVPVAATVNGIREGIQLRFSGGGKSIEGYSGIMDVIRVITFLFGAAALNRENAIEISSLKPDCDIPSVRFTIPKLIPTGIELPLPCGVWETKMNVTIPKELKYPFTAYISGAKWLCKDTGKLFPVDGVDAEVYIGAMRFTIPIRSGAGSLALKLEDIKDIVAAGAETIAPEIEAPERVTAECDKKGEVEGAAELQAWLSVCYAGKKYRVEGLGPLFKIVRENGSHFWGKRYQDIIQVLRSNP